MTTRTLFSDTQPLLVACLMNNLAQDKTLSANSFLSMAKPVQCLSDTDCTAASTTTDSSSPFCASHLFQEPFLPATSSSTPSPVSADGTVHLASSVSSATADAKASGCSSPSSEGQLDHMESLLHRLPDDLTLEQKHHAEEFIRTCANVFSRSEFNIGRPPFLPYAKGMGPRFTPF